VLVGAVRFLDIHINAMKSVKSQILHRKQMKLEFDCYEQKVSRLKQRRNSQGDCQRIERNELKLQTARQALEEVTFDLYRVFAKYESERDTMLNGELEMVRQVMYTFYAKNAEATDFVIPEEVDRCAVDQRTEDIYKSMVSKEMEQRSLKMLTAAATTPSLSASVSAPTLPSAEDGGQDTSHPLNLTAGVGTLTAQAPTSPLGDNDTARPTTDDQQQTQQNHHQQTPEQPEQEASEDELTEKLRTIQLSRPAVPPIKTFRLGRPLYRHNDE